MTDRTSEKPPGKLSVPENLSGQVAPPEPHPDSQPGPEPTPRSDAENRPARPAETRTASAIGDLQAVSPLQAVGPIQAVGPLQAVGTGAGGTAEAAMGSCLINAQDSAAINANLAGLAAGTVRLVG